MSALTTKAFWFDALERAVKTAAQTATVALGAGAVDLLSVPWQATLSISGGAAVLSLLTSIGSAQLPGRETASATKAVEPVAPQD